MFTVRHVERFAEIGQLFKQTQRGTLDFQDADRQMARRPNRGIARHPRQYVHHAELHARRNLGDFRRPLSGADVNFSPSRDYDVKSVPAPFALAHDHFAGRVIEQPHIRPDLFAVVITAEDDDLQVEFVFVMPVVFGGQVGYRACALYSREHSSALGIFLWHKTGWGSKFFLRGHSEGTEQSGWTQAIPDKANGGAGDLESFAIGFCSSIRGCRGA